MSVEEDSSISIEREEQFTMSEEAEIEEKRQIAEEPWDPEHPQDLVPEGEKESQPEEAEESADLEEEDEDSREDEDEDKDDSIVVGDDVVDLDCKDHDKCVAAAGKLDDLIMSEWKCKSKPRERRAALAEVLCDHYDCN